MSESESASVTFGSIITLRHVQTQRYLRSLSRNYVKPPSTSGQQMVVATMITTPETYWIVKRPHGSEGAFGDDVRHGSVVRLEHWPTRMNLHSHSNAPAPVTGAQREVTAYSEERNGVGDPNDDWQVEIDGGAKWLIDRPIQLIHVLEKVALHSHAGRSDPQLTAGEQEVTGFSDRNEDDFWVAGVVGTIPLPTREQADRITSASSEGLEAMREVLGDFRTNAKSVTDLVERSLESARELISASQGTADEVAKVKVEIDARLGAAREMTGVLDTANAQTKDAQLQAAAVVDTIQAFAKSAEETVNRILAIHTDAIQTQELTKTKSEHIEGGRRHADEVRSELDSALNEARQSAISAEAQHQASRGALENINTLHLESQTIKARAQTDSDEIAKSRTAAETNTAATSKLAEIARSTESKVVEYEARLAELNDAAQKQKETIDALLLGATNANLASVFDKRAQTFKKPEIWWQRMFLGALILLLALALSEVVLFRSAKTIPEWQDIARMAVSRLPFIIPIIWLAIHSARQASFAKRMEEEYAFKATISTCFYGYRREMAEISNDLSPSSPLAKLCTDTLETIAKPPGAVYDKHRMDPTPATAAAEVLRPVADAVVKVAEARVQELKKASGEK